MRYADFVRKFAKLAAQSVESTRQIIVNAALKCVPAVRKNAIKWRGHPFDINAML